MLPPIAITLSPAPLSLSSPLNQGKVEVATVWTWQENGCSQMLCVFLSLSPDLVCLRAIPDLWPKWKSRLGVDGWGRKKGCCPFSCKMHILIIKPQQNYCMSTFWVEFYFFKPVCESLPAVLLAFFSSCSLSPFSSKKLSSFLSWIFLQSQLHCCG